MNFTVLSQKQIPNDYLAIKEANIIISICSGKNEVKIPKTPYCCGELHLNFDDTEDLDSKHICFDMNIAERILEFVNSNIDRVSRIVVQCEAGICRSVGVAAALSKIINNKDDEVFIKGAPNMLVYLTILETFFSDPKAIQKYNKIFYIRNNYLKKQLTPVVYRMLEYKVNKRNREG